MKTGSTRQLLGSHLSAAGGLYKALLLGSELGCTTIQIFTHSNRQWHIAPLSDKDIELFIATKQETGITSVVVHASYLINLASQEQETRRKSIAALTKEIERCNLLDIELLVLHPGSRGTASIADSAARVAEGLDIALDSAQGSCKVLLETMAGQGSSLGSTFEELALIRNTATKKSRIGFCADTCHLFAAGYDFGTPASYQTLWQNFDAMLGINHLKAIHLNDSKTARGSRVDRHTHIGEGTLGLESFRLIMNDPRFAMVPKILETPKDETLEQDRKNLACLRSLIS